MTSPLDDLADPVRRRIVEAGRTHARVEASGDLEATMATLDDDPFYELLPMGRGFGGRDVVRRYYEHFFAHAVPRVLDFRLRGEWVTEEGLGQEYQMLVGGFGEAGASGPDRRRFDVIGILKVGSDGLLTGERLYAADELLEIFLGPVMAETAALEADLR